MTYKALQNEAEHARFVEIIKAQGIRSYLEIGSKFGGSLWRAAKSMPAGSKIVSVDMPSGTKHWPESQVSLGRCISELKLEGYDAHLVWGDSTDSVVIEKVRNLGPFDCVFLDGNHTRPYVEKDWANYGAMSSIVAFHDISWKRPEDWAGYFRIDVPEFWNDLKSGYRHEEIKLDPTEKDNGIGILWR